MTDLDKKLIAEFLGGEVIATYISPTMSMYSVKAPWVKASREKGLMVGGFEDKMMLSNCEFDKSWDWFMQAWEKFRKLQGMPRTYLEHHDSISAWIVRNNLEEANHCLIKALNWLKSGNYSGTN